MLHRFMDKFGVEGLVSLLVFITCSLVSVALYLLEVAS